MKINLNFTLTALDGSEIMNDGIPVNCSRVAANLIMQYPMIGSNLMKWQDWAKELWTNGFVDLDRADQALFKKFFEDLPNVSLYLKAAIFDAMVRKDPPKEKEKPSTNHESSGESLSE